MPYDLLVDISDDLDPELRDRLISLAYRASRSREVALVLNGVSRETVDRTLDPIVASEGIAVAGVRYVDPEEVLTLLRNNAVRQCVVLGRDPDWISGFNGDTPPVRRPEAGIGLLEDLLATSGAV